MSDVSAANDGFHAALNAAFGDDAAPMREVWSARDGITPHHTDLTTFG